MKDITKAQARQILKYAVEDQEAGDQILLLLAGSRHHTRLYRISVARKMLDDGMSRADAAKALQARFGVSRRCAYLALEKALDLPAEKDKQKM